MRKYVYLFFMAFAVTVSAPIYSYDQSPPCYRQIQQSFFRQDLVATALSLYSVHQSNWLNIYNSLQRASYQVPTLVQAYAASLNPNPLDPVFMPDQALGILQKALFDVFQGVMGYTRGQDPYSVMDQNTINGMFKYIWEQQVNQIVACFQSAQVGR